MRDDPDTVCLYIPLMKDLNMSWHAIKKCSRSELNGLLQAYNTHETMHAFDGYTSESISNLAKQDPSIRSKYNRSMLTKSRIEDRLLIKKKKQVGFKQSLGIK